ncbi:hypothetical protein [Flavobacterium suzhouense]|uniref:Uncharacterized protein n=1 Tax=Flavobacterium suzhouense TaxID=1529638 RepID=A0ABW5NPF0_9FLAO
MKYLFYLLLALSIPLPALAQTDIVTPTKIALIKNTVGEASMSIDIQLDINKNESIDFDHWINHPEDKPKVSLQYGDQKSDCPLRVRPEASAKNSIGFIVSGFTESTLERFLNRDHDNQIKLLVENDVRVNLLHMPDTMATSHLLVIKADVLNKMINDQLTITADDRSGFLTSLNNFYYYQNKVDFGVQPSQDTVKTSYILTMKLQNAYNRKNFLKCDDSQKGTPIYWSLDTRLSTEFKDSLNYIKFYPVNLMWENYSKKIPFQLSIKAGHESSQDFISKRAALDASITLITPNAINLTTAQSNRLRLKPVITAGIKGYYDYSNNVEAFTSGQPHVDGYYYVPVFNNYAIIFEGTAFYDMSTVRNPDNKIQGNYSVTLGAEIPKTGFKAMFKYVDGKSDINFKDGSVIAIGLLMDFFQEKK